MACGNMFHLISEDKARDYLTGLIDVKEEEDGDDEEEHSEDYDDIDGVESEEEEEEEGEEDGDEEAGGGKKKKEDEPRVRDEENKRPAFAKILLNLCVLVKLLNSYRTKIDVAKYKQLSMDTYKLIVVNFPWASVPGIQFNRKKLVNFG